MNQSEFHGMSYTPRSLRASLPLKKMMLRSLPSFWVDFVSGAILNFQRVKGLQPLLNLFSAKFYQKPKLVFSERQDVPGWRISMNGQEQYHADELTAEWTRYSHLMLVCFFCLMFTYG